MLVSFVISTYNRRDVLLDTLRKLATCGLPEGTFEIIVVDNASPDGTAAAIRSGFPHVRLLAETINRGPTSKNLGIAIARGEFVVFLDDDSFPVGDAMSRMIAHFRSHPRLGAAVFVVTLPDGTRECSAYPDVFIGCGTGFRAAALREVGGLPEDFFMQAEEYDLSLRLLDANWSVQTFNDLHVTHLKTKAARYPDRVTYLDVRNNLTLIARYFPDEWVLPFAYDWTRRYAMIARTTDHQSAWRRGVKDGIGRWIKGVGRRPVRDATFERFTRKLEIERALQKLAKDLTSPEVILIDLGKNTLPCWRAARKAGLVVLAVADRNLGGHGFRYRGVPIITDEQALRLPFKAAVVNNLSPVHAEARVNQWRRLTERPVVIPQY